MKTKKLSVITLLLTTSLLAGCQLIPRSQRLDNSETLLQDPQVRLMAAQHPDAAKKVFKTIRSLERRLEEIDDHR